MGLREVPLPSIPSVCNTSTLQYSKGGGIEDNDTDHTVYRE